MAKRTTCGSGFDMGIFFGLNTARGIRKNVCEKFNSTLFQQPREYDLGYIQGYLKE